jgi:phosphoglycolate phosphatase
MEKYKTNKSLTIFMKAVIFDFDGVIIDSYESNYQCHKKKFEGIGYEEHKSFFEGNVHEIREGLVKSGKIKNNPSLDIHTLLREHLLNKQVIDAKVRKVLIKLKEKYPLFIISSFRGEYIEEFLEKHNASDIFKEILGSEHHKKKDIKFNLLFDKYNLSKDNCVFITDTLGDILEANKVKIKTIAVDFGFHEKERLEKGNPYKIISCFEDIVKVVDEM